MFIMQMPPPLSHGLVTTDWLFLRLLMLSFLLMLVCHRFSDMGC